MYKLLLKNRITNSTFLVGLMLMLVGMRLFHGSEPYSGPAGWLFQEWFGMGIVGFEWIWVIVLLVIQLYVLLDFTLRYRISSEASLIPGFIYVMLTCLIPAFHTFNPLLFANTFLLFSFWQLFAISPRQSSGKMIFNAGMWIALASLFYASYIWFIIALISGINILRSWRYNDIKVVFLGLLTPFFLVGVYYFWVDRFDEYWSALKASISIISFQNGIDYFNLFIVVILLLGILIVVVFNTRVLTKKTILKQNYFKIIYWALFACLIQFFLQKNQSVEHLLILTFPLTILLSEYLINWKESKSIALTNLILVLVLILQFHEFLPKLI